MRGVELAADGNDAGLNDAKQKNLAGRALIGPSLGLPLAPKRSASGAAAKKTSFIAAYVTPQSVCRADS